MSQDAKETGQGGRPGDPYPDRRGIIDTLDSIVVAFILAFVFRAFVVEAFVIPTGSMAPTLYGAHGMVLCEECGTEFAYGLQDPSARVGQPVQSTDVAVCPNCQHGNTNLRQNDRAHNQDGGDRILVLKWPYDFGIEALGPQRWEVTVFKDPSDGTTNYIKRLVGMPNEVLMLLDGDVYVAPVEELSGAAQEAFATQRQQKYDMYVGHRRRGLGLDQLPAAVLAELDGKLRIARKSRRAQESLWFGVYDQDYPPRDWDPSQPRWEARLGEESPWRVEARRVRFGGGLGQADSLQLRHCRIDAQAAYNVRQHQSIAGHSVEVADLRVSAVVEAAGPAGQLRIRLEKRGRVFWATFGFDGLVTLTETAGSDGPPGADGKPWLSTRVAPWTPGRWVEVAFENVDYRLAISVDGREVLASSEDPASDAYYGPDVSALRRDAARGPGHVEPPQLYGQDGAFEVIHLRVERDEYYFDQIGPAAWGFYEWGCGVWGSTGWPILLAGDEFFMLGDNSAASKDSRLWTEVGPHLVERGEAYQLGTVPRDQLIGKAFFVYWPSGHRLSWLPGRLGNIGFIPNVGRMRWIR